MGPKYLSFDIEIAKDLPDGMADLMAYRPLGLTCAATLASDTDQLWLWHGRGPHNRPADRMSREDCQKLVDHLETMVNGGYTILAWNGLGFDFDILAEESGMLESCRRLAGGHLKMMFHAF